MQSIDEVTAGGTTPVIRMRRAPQCDPPFDDELSAEVWAPVGQLRLPWPDSSRPEPSRPEPGHPGFAGARPTRSAKPNATPAFVSLRESVSAQSPASAAPSRTPLAAEPAGALPGGAGDARLAVRRFVGVCVEVLNGYRPAAHLRRLARPIEAASVVAQGLSGARRVAELRRSACVSHRRPVRPGPVAVLGIHLCEPHPGAVEAGGLLGGGGRAPGGG